MIKKHPAPDAADKVAHLVHRFGLTTPAVFFLEANKPYYSLVSQVLHTAGSLVQPFFGPQLHDLSQSLGSLTGWENLIKKIEESGGGEK